MSVNKYRIYINPKKKYNATRCIRKESSDYKDAIDEESIKGRFGWKMIGSCPIPCIYRSGEKYCSVRIAEQKVLNKYLTYLHEEIYSCLCIKSFYITENEAGLLNEINTKHCDYHFGLELFTQRDLIVNINDTLEFYNFLYSCYSKLLSHGRSNSLERCGFIRINKESVVPYTVHNNEKYVPLFYFEGETKSLKERSYKIEGWDLSYLKFCCKVQGIRNELFACDSCLVLRLTDIKTYFSVGTVFEDYWPRESVDSNLLISANTRNQSQIQQIHQWIKQPTAPPNLQLSYNHKTPYPLISQSEHYSCHLPHSSASVSTIITTYSNSSENSYLKSPKYRPNIGYQ